MGDWIFRVHNQKFRNFWKRNPSSKSPEELIPKSWKTPERVISKKDNSQFLVKWMNLSYEECTWEPVGIIDPKLIAEYKKRQKPGLTSSANLIRNKDLTSFSIYKFHRSPPFLKFPLFDYQLDGVNWLLKNWLSERNSILADEMGLGKTIQAIALCGAIRELKEYRPVIIIVPLSTISNW